MPETPSKSSLVRPALIRAEFRFGVNGSTRCQADETLTRADLPDRVSGAAIKAANPQPAVEGFLTGAR
jgi:hypothetical protein